MKTKFRFSAVIFSCIIVFLLALVHLYSPSVDAANSGKNVAISITPSPVPQRSKTDAISTITGKPVSETNQVHAFAALPSIPTPNTSSQFEYTENIVVPSDGSTVQSQSLINGVAYTVTISGTFIWGNCDPVTCPNDAPDYKRYGDAGYLTDDHWASFATGTTLSGPTAGIKFTTTDGTIYQYVLSGNNLDLNNITAGTTDQINSSGTTVSGLAFTRLATSGISGTNTITMSFTLTSTVTRAGRGTEQKSFQTTVGTR